MNILNAFLTLCKPARKATPNCDVCGTRTAGHSVNKILFFGFGVAGRLPRRILFPGKFPRPSVDTPLKDANWHKECETHFVSGYLWIPDRSRLVAGDQYNSSAEQLRLICSALPF